MPSGAGYRARPASPSTAPPSTHSLTCARFSARRTARRRQLDAKGWRGEPCRLTSRYSPLRCPLFLGTKLRSGARAFVSVGLLHL